MLHTSLGAVNEEDNFDPEQDFSSASFKCQDGNCPLTFQNLQEADKHYRASHPNTSFESVTAGLTSRQPAPPPTVPPGPRPASQPITIPSDLGAILANPLLLGQLQALTGGAGGPSPTSPGVLPFPCTVCEKAFDSEGNLRTHMKRRHKSRAQGITCPMPGCRSPEVPGMEGLVAHLLSAHDGQAASPKPVRPPPSQDVSNVLGAHLAGLSLGGAKKKKSYIPSLVGSPSEHGPPEYSYGWSQGGWQGGLRSGQDRTANPRARVHVTWPHEAVDTVLSQRSFAYKDLTFPALMAGALNAIVNTRKFQQVPESMQLYLKHLSLLAHAMILSGNTTAIRDFHRSILLQIESGQLKWSADCFSHLEQMKLHFLAGLRPEAKAAASSKKPQAEKKLDPERERRISEAQATCCKEYGVGKCGKPDGHEGLLHYCYYCYTVRNDRDAHPQNQCSRGPPNTGGRRK